MAIDNDLDNEIAGDALKSPTISPDQLTKIVSVSTTLRNLYRDIAKTEQALEALQEERRSLEHDVLPALMDSAGVKMLGLDTEEQILRDEEIFASISKDNMNKAAAWMDKNNFGALVKSVIGIPIDREKKGERERITHLLQEAGVSHTLASTIHAQTLKAFVKESIAEGRKLPEAISVHIQPTVKIKALPKPKAKSKSRSKL